MIGGGVIGVEYATIFSALDVPVTLIESRDTILDFVDREIVDDFIHQMRDRGMTIRLGAAVKEIAVEPARRRGHARRRAAGALGDPALRGRAVGERRRPSGSTRSGSRWTAAGG